MNNVRIIRIAHKIVAKSAEKEVERLFKTLLPKSPWRNRAFAVGGYVRDELLGLEAKDLDIVVEMNGGSEKLTKWLKKKFPDQIGTPRQMGASYPIWEIVFKGTIEYEGDTYETNGAEIQFADTQKEGFQNPDSRQREVEYGTLKDDISRRDFTINMILKDMSTGEIIDFTGVSKQDLKDGVLRGHPEVDFNQILKDDPLRMIRLLRFQAKYGWKVPKEVLRIVKQNASRIQIVSSERIMDELGKVMKFGKLDKAIRLMKVLGLLKYVMPEVQAMVGVEQSPDHHAEGSSWTCKNFEPR